MLRLCLLLTLAVGLSTTVARAQDTAFPAAEAALDSARTAAGQDRHQDAIRWYRRAIAIDPSLENDVLRDMADQYTWASEPDSAVTLYRAYLATHPNDIDAEIGLGRALAWSGEYDEAIRTYEAALPHAGDRRNEILVGIARVTSWRDKHSLALSQYEAVLAADSTNIDARIGRAQVTNWSGKHREAAVLYQEILDDHPDNTDAREGLAAAQFWMGRTDLARETLRDGEQTGSMRAFANDVERSISPDASYTYEQNQDSDDIKRQFHTVRAGFWPGDMTRLGGEYGHGKITEPARPDVSRDWLAAVLRHRFNETWAANVSAGYQWNSFDRAALGPETFWKDDFNTFTIDGYATLTPRDWIRWDFGLMHGSVANPDAIFRGITLTAVTAGLDWRLKSNLLSASSVDMAFYSDDNRRVGFGSRIVWQPLWRLPVRQNHRFTSTTGFGYFGYDETNDNGYYDPRQYLNFYTELALDMTFSRRVSGHIGGRIGLDRENSDDWITTGRFDISGTLMLHPRFSLSAGYYNSNSQLDSREGYAMDGFFINLGYVHHD